MMGGEMSWGDRFFLCMIAVIILLIPVMFYRLVMAL